MTDRRKFLAQIGGFAFAGLLPMEAEARQHQLQLFDLHTHPGVFPSPGWQGAPADLIDRTLPAMVAQKLRGGFFSLVADLPLIRRGPNGIEQAGRYLPGAAWSEYKRQLETFRKLTADGRVTMCTSARPVEKKIAGYISVEGGDFLEGSTERLAEMHQDGITSIQLVHYIPNELGDLQTAAPVHQGLSSAGAAIVRRMNSLGMVIDVAHASTETVKMVTDITTQPIMLSHSVLKFDDGKDRPIAARTITREHAILVADTGGVIGAWPSGYHSDLKEFAVSILRLADAVGIDHVGIGTDMDANFKPVLSGYEQLPELAGLLRLSGMNEKNLQAVFSGNALRVLRKVIKQ